MEKNTTYEDLVFRHKPKEYGGYRLRKNYPVRLLISTLFGLLLVSGVYLYPILSREKDDNPDPGHLKIKSNTTINYSQLSAPPPVEVEMIEKPPVAITEMPKIKTVKFLPPVVKPDEEVEDEEIPPTQEEMQKANIGAENIEGEDSLVNYYIPPNVDVEMPEEPEVVVEEKPKPKPKPEIFDWSSKAPEFPGGGDALRKFLAKNIEYPEEAREFNMEARVFAQFVVEPDGSLSGIHILKSGGPIFDREVMRVMRLMPNWIPGENSGKPVRVRTVVPVRFELADR